MAFSHIDVHAAKVGTESRFQRKQTFWMGSLIVSASLGAVAGLCGIVIGAMSFLGLTGHIRGISTLTTVLVVASFPLLFGAAHCLDRLDDIEREIRIEYCRERGLKSC